VDSEIEKPFLLPLSSALSLKNFDMVKYNVIDDNQVYFKDSEGSLFCSKLLDNSKYTNPSEFFEFEGQRIKFPPTTEDLVKKASILAKGDFDIDKRITIIIEDGQLICKGQNNMGSIEAHIKIKGNKTVQFSINPEFFSQILKETSFGIIGEDRILFKANNFKHLISLYEPEEG